MANWRQNRFRTLLIQKFEPMRGVWAGPLPLDISVAAILGDNSANRQAAILSILTQGELHEIAA
jgi:hypothetical protein